jgi:hypothetical protein
MTDMKFRITPVVVHRTGATSFRLEYQEDNRMRHDFGTWQSTIPDQFGTEVLARIAAKKFVDGRKKIEDHLAKSIQVFEID